MTGDRPDRGLRVGICASYDLGRAGGVNTHVRAQAAALRRLGHDVCVFGATSAPLASDEVSLGGCMSLVIGDTETAFGIDPRSWWTSKRLLRERRFDVLHMHEPLMPLPSWFVLLQASVPVVATFHTYREQGHKWYPQYRWIFDPLMKRIGVRLAVSEAAKRTVAAHFPGEYEVIPNAIDVERFTAPAPAPAAMSSGRRSVLYVGRLEPRKGIDRLLRAMAIVRQRVPCTQLVVVGDGPDRAALESVARDVDVEVCFAGRVSDDDLPGFYQAADVVCSPALGDESFGIVLLEAMAAGAPVVASDLPAFHQVLDGGRLGELFEPGNSAELAARVLRLLRRPDNRERLRSAGLVAVPQYDWSVLLPELLSVYELVARR